MTKTAFKIYDIINTKDGIEVGVLTGSLIGDDKINMVYIVRKKDVQFDDIKEFFDRNLKRKITSDYDCTGEFFSEATDYHEFDKYILIEDLQVRDI